ncbi:MAG: cytochrome c peroxidase [Polyangiales bacterium]
MDRALADGLPGDPDVRRGGHKLSGQALALLILALLVASCGESAGSDDAAATPWPLTPFPSLPDVMKNVPAARIELGHLLFYDPILSIDQQTSCSTCHSERWGLSDALRQSVGHGAGLLAGPGRQGPNTVRRNSTTLYNVAFRDTLLWDGGARTIEEQAHMPLFDEDEMSADPETVVSDLSSVPEYAELFRQAFPDDPQVSIENLVAALAAYQRTLLSMAASYDKYAEGRTQVLTEEMTEGMFRFAEMGCHDCHVPPLFESDVFANRHVAEIEGVIDYGREEVTGRVEDRGKFRAVTLRNIAFTEPYFHNGTVDSLEEAVRHELEEGDQPFTDEDVRLITAFISKALRDGSHEPIRPASVPSGLPLSIDDPGSR